MTRNVTLPLIVAAVLALAAACGTGSPQAPRVAQAGSGPSATPGSGSAQLSVSDTERTWLRYAACLRQHGADEPDPSFDGAGDPQWAVNPKTVPQPARDACASILQSLNLHVGQPADPARIAALTRFSGCIRQHGIADFPDPDSTGNFPAHGDPTAEPGWTAAFGACRSLMPAGKS
jgi:hypothetical protein